MSDEHNLACRPKNNPLFVSNWPPLLSSPNNLSQVSVRPIISMSNPLLETTVKGNADLTSFFPLFHLFFFSHLSFVMSVPSHHPFPH